MQFIPTHLAGDDDNKGSTYFLKNNKLYNKMIQ